MNSTPSANLEKIEDIGKQVNLRGWKNKLIFGDNARVLKYLEKNLSERPKLVYIDPPFATKQTFSKGESKTQTISRSENGVTAYNDFLTGKRYLEFLRKRLVFLKRILAEEGSIYVHIGDEAVSYVKIIMDEIFGEKNCKNNITRIKCNPKNFERRAYGNFKDNILFYTKSNESIWNGSWESLSEDEIKRRFSKKNKKGERYTTTPLHAPGESNGKTGKKWKGLKPGEGRHWRYNPKKLSKLDKEGKIEWSSNGNPRLIRYAKESIRKGKKRQDVWKFKDPQHPSYPTQKNKHLLKEVIKASSNEDDIVLDAFCGSGATLIAAEELNRRWIGIDSSKVAIKQVIENFKQLKKFQKFSLYKEKENVNPLE